MMGTRVAMLAAAVLAATVSACGDGNNSSVVTQPPPGAQEVTVLDLGTISLTATNQSQTFDVGVSGASSLVIVADGGDATDIDIERLQAPSGAELITVAPGDANPLTGSVSPQEVGGSVATAIVPRLPAVPLEQGTYSFSVASFDAAGTRVPATVHLTAIVNHRDTPTVGVLPLRAFFVGSPGLDAANAASSVPFQKILHQLRLAFGAIGIDVQLVDLVDIGGEPGTALAVLDVLDSTTDRLVPDRNLNRQSDEMDELFALSGGRTGNVVNLFFVSEFFTQSGAVAVSGGVPGPSIVSGTNQSGIAVSTLGGLDQQSDSDLEDVGFALEMELAGYLGALGTIDPDNFTIAQQLALLRNPAVVSTLP